MKSINDIIEHVIEAEGGYVDIKNDLGGPTRYGITKATAERNGYKGEMRDFPLSMARSIYYSDYVVNPGFDQVLLLSPTIAAELVDTGVNMGPSTAAKMLQECLNAFNMAGKLYADIAVDGKIGRGTILALRSFLAARQERGQDVLLKALNCLQGARYISLATKDQKQESFVFGWIDNRIKL